MSDPRHARKTEVRARMQQTGENYTTAAAAIRAQRTRPATPEHYSGMDRQDRYQEAVREARAAAEPAHLALWNAWGESFAPYHHLVMVLSLPTGDSVQWITYSTGGRDLAQQIDQHARSAGLGLADYRTISQRHVTADYTNGPLQVAATDLVAVFEDVLAGRGASEEHQAQAASDPLHKTWFGFHDNSGASLYPPLIDFERWGLDG
ncbi:hypothetical protein ACPC54_30360 [Kitasatospora sp. NPDC094028]